MALLLQALSQEFCGANSTPALPNRHLTVTFAH